MIKRIRNQLLNKQRQGMEHLASYNARGKVRTYFLVDESGDKFVLGQDQDGHLIYREGTLG